MNFFMVRIAHSASTERVVCAAHNFTRERAGLADLKAGAGFTVSSGKLCESVTCPAVEGPCCTPGLKVLAAGFSALFRAGRFC